MKNRDVFVSVSIFFVALATYLTYFKIICFRSVYGMLVEGYLIPSN